MMIEHEWCTSAQTHHSSLKKSIAPLLHIVLFSIGAGIGHYYAWKVNGRSDISSRHIAGGKVLSSRYCSKTRQTLKKFDFRFTFLCRKRAFFHARVKKKLFFFSLHFFFLFYNFFICFYWLYNKLMRMRILVD